MNIALHQPTMSRDQFLVWVEQQERRWEFDGFRPVAMVGSTLNHNRITVNLLAALNTRLKGGQCQAFGLDAGLATAGEAVRYPDALVTCSKVAGDARLVPDVVAVFEVISPSTAGVDRIIKLREYQAVPSIRRYVIIEQTGAGLSLYTRPAGGDWTATALTADETLRMPEIGVEIPVSELYEGIALPAREA